MMKMTTLTMALVLVLLLLVILPPAAVVIVVAAGIDPRYAINITVYHVNELNYTKGDITNMDTADVFGDLYFDTRAYADPIACNRTHPLIPDCTNPEIDTSNLGVTEIVVEVDRRFSNYSRCNIVDGKYECKCVLPPPLAMCGPTVGYEDVAASHVQPLPAPDAPNYLWWRYNLAQYLGGAWYSFLEEGKCPHTPAAAAAAPLQLASAYAQPRSHRDGDGGTSNSLDHRQRTVNTNNNNSSNSNNNNTNNNSSSNSSNSNSNSNNNNSSNSSNSNNNNNNNNNDNNNNNNNSNNSSNTNTGDSCYWRVVDVRKRVRKNCTDAIIQAAVQSVHPDCFGACKQPRNVTSPCWIECFFSTLMGKTSAHEVYDPSHALNTTLLHGAFLQSFADPEHQGCPPV